MAELDRIEVLIELQGSRRQVSLKKESPEQLQAEFRHFDSSIELAVCSDRDSPGRKFLLQRWSEKWRCLVWFPDPSCMGGAREGKEGSGE